MLAIISIVQKTDQYTSVIRKQGKLEVTVRDNDLAKIGTRDERKPKVRDYIKSPTNVAS